MQKWNEDNEEKTEPESLLSWKWVWVPNEWQWGREKRCWQWEEWMGPSKWLWTWQGESQSSCWKWGAAGRTCLWTHTMTTGCWTQVPETWPEAVTLISLPYYPSQQGNEESWLSLPWAPAAIVRAQWWARKCSSMWSILSAEQGNASPCKGSFPSSVPQHCTLYLDTQFIPFFFFPFHLF